MTIQQLHYIIVISETGSINKASELLYVAQPSLTSAIQELEKELGFAIFHRSRRGVTLTVEGTEFLLHARTLYNQFEDLQERFGKTKKMKKKFGVSTQHYSFAVKAFVELVKEYDTSRYEFAVRETKTKDVISDVANLRSEIGILYFNDFNRTAITKLLRTAGLEYHSLITCQPYVYLWEGHPLAHKKCISLKELQNYPCLSFEQGDNDSFYYAEEILSTKEYARIIKANDRATMLNLMIGLNGYTLCCGVICEELNGGEFLRIPFNQEEEKSDNTMEIVYITKENTHLSTIGELYIQKICEELNI